MTYCLGIKLKSGLVAMADTRISSGTETTTAKKVTISLRNKHALFIMTSGLRSVRDKAITYFEEVLEQQDPEFNKMYKAVNAFAEQLRRVSKEDREALETAGYDFNLQAIVGGQLEDDQEPKLYRLYAEGNWVEIGPGTPFVIIGNSGYGKPILNRVLKYESTIPFALKTGFLSFDSTRISANDVGYPLDVLICPNDTFQVIEERYQETDLREASASWEKYLVESINNTSDQWSQQILAKMKIPLANGL